MLELMKQVVEQSKEKYGVSSIYKPGMFLRVMIAEVLGLDIVGGDLYDKSGNRCKCIFANKDLMNFQLSNVSVGNFSRVSKYKKFIFCSMLDSFNIDKVYICDDYQIIHDKAMEMVKKKRNCAHINITGKWIKENCRELTS